MIYYEDAVEHLFLVVYTKTIHELQFDKGLSWFTWGVKDGKRDGSDLGKLWGITRERARQNLGEMKIAVKEYLEVNSCSSLEQIFSKINACLLETNCVWQTDEFSDYLVQEGITRTAINPAAILSLAELANYPVNYRLYSRDSFHYVTASWNTDEMIKAIVHEAITISKKFGCCMYFEDFYNHMSNLNWFMDDTVGLARSVVEQYPHIVLLDNGLAFGYSKIDSNPVKTQLIKVFCGYQKVFTFEMVKGLERQFSYKKSMEEREVLRRSSELFDEYSRLRGYILVSGPSSRIASDYLLTEIEKSNVESQIGDRAARSIVEFINENGGVVEAEPLMSHLRKCKIPSHTRNAELPYSSLFLRYGSHSSGVYTTLNHRYNDQTELLEGRIENDKRYRDSSLAEWIKHSHDYKCQICGETLMLSEGKPYAEAHHIIPFGAPHEGPDTPGNMICVCPNHHVLLDTFSMILDKDKLLSNDLHDIDVESIRYHNNRVPNKCKFIHNNKMQ